MIVAGVNGEAGFDFGSYVVEQRPKPVLAPALGLERVPEHAPVPGLVLVLELVPELVLVLGLVPGLVRALELEHAADEHASVSDV